jgi:hypothetical protein
MSINIFQQHQSQQQTFASNTLDYRYLGRNLLLTLILLMNFDVHLPLLRPLSPFRILPEWH